MYNAAWTKIVVMQLLFCCTAHFCYAQKTELRANAYSGLFSFRGSGSVATTTVSTVGPGDAFGYYNAYSYGRKSGHSFAFELQGQRVTKYKFLFGAGVGLESLQSKTVIDSVWTQMGSRSTTGNIILTNTFVTLNPFIGKRFAIGGVALDVQAGIDVAAAIKVHEEASLVLGEKYTFSKTRNLFPVDLRPRIQINGYYKRIGLLAGYSYGTANFFNDPGYDYLNKETYTNFLRLGISYKLK